MEHSVHGISLIPPSSLVTSSLSLSNTKSRYLDAALYWFAFGFKVIPIVPHTKKTAVKWDPWLDNLSQQKIIKHWSQNPDHELGCIVGNDIIVFDADSSASTTALLDIEHAFDITANLIIETAKGVHHYFKRGNGTFAKTDSHSTVDHPKRIDVKATRSLVVLPPSTGKEIALNVAESINGLVEVNQEFIDSVYRHNGRSMTLPTNQTSSIINQPVKTGHAYLGLEALLAHIDADCGYDDWIRVLMGIFHYTRGSDDGFEIANAWSSKSGKYHGENEVHAKWNSFNLCHPRPVKLGTIIHMVQNGHEIYDEAENPFEIVSNVAVGGAQ